VVSIEAAIFTTESSRLWRDRLRARRKKGSGGFDRDKRDTGDKTIRQAESKGQAFSLIKPSLPSPSSLLKAFEFF
jgi:hypothetical protein